jgi:ATP synthase protein I
MPAYYAVILRRSAMLTAPIALLMIVLGAVLGGAKGLIGAALGVALVIAFFGISVLVVGRAAKVSPQAMMAAAVGTFVVKILILIILLGTFQNSTAFNGKWFGLTVIVCVIAYSAAQMVSSMRLKMLYVDVEPDKDR